MSELSFNKATILVVGGAGFVGSNLVLKLLEQDPACVIIVDNLLSSDITNVTEDPRVDFRFGTITDDSILSAQIGRAHVRTTDTNAHIACRLQLEKINNTNNNNQYTADHI